MPQILRARRPDQQVRALLRWFNLAPGHIEDRSVPMQRRIWRVMALAMGRRPKVGSVITQTIDGPGGPIELRIFSPADAGTPRPGFLWCHGGGFMVGSLDSADSICRTIARTAGCVAIAVRYRLAPEHALTACREDFLAALEWVAQHGATLGIDTTRLAIGGDSAGGNICAAVAQHAKRHGGPKLCLQVLAYPATELVDEFPSLAQNASGYLITARMLHSIKARIGEMPGAEEPWLSPRRQPDLKGLPPALVISAGFDPIRDDGLDYAARLRAAGVPVQLLHYAGQIHGFLNFDSIIDAGHDALQRIATALSSAFSGDDTADSTIEMADGPTCALAAPFRSMTELVMTSLIGWATAERVWLTLLGRLSAATDDAARTLLEWRFVPGVFLRHSAIVHADALQARQTWPDAASPRGAQARAPHQSTPQPARASTTRRRGARERSSRERST